MRLKSHLYPLSMLLLLTMTAGCGGEPSSSSSAHKPAASSSSSTHDDIPPPLEPDPDVPPSARQPRCTHKRRAPGAPANPASSKVAKREKPTAEEGCTPRAAVVTERDAKTAEASWDELKKAMLSDKRVYANRVTKLVQEVPHLGPEVLDFLMHIVVKQRNLRHTDCPTPIEKLMGKGCKVAPTQAMLDRMIHWLKATSPKEWKSYQAPQSILLRALVPFAEANPAYAQQTVNLLEAQYRRVPQTAEVNRLLQQERALSAEVAQLQEGLKKYINIHALNQQYTSQYATLHRSVTNSLRRFNQAYEAQKQEEERKIKEKNEALRACRRRRYALQAIFSDYTKPVGDILFELYASAARQLAQGTAAQKEIAHRAFQAALSSYCHDTLPADKTETLCSLVKEVFPQHAKRAFDSLTEADGIQSNNCRHAAALLVPRLSWQEIQAAPVLPRNEREAKVWSCVQSLAPRTASWQEIDHFKQLVRDLERNQPVCGSRFQKDPLYTAIAERFLVLAFLSDNPDRIDFLCSYEEVHVQRVISAIFADEQLRNQHDQAIRASLNLLMEIVRDVNHRSYMVASLIVAPAVSKNLPAQYQHH